MVRKYNTKYAANILGYIGIINDVKISDKYYESGDRIGKSGIDKSYEKFLRGKKGVKHIIQDVTGKQMPYKNGELDNSFHPGKFNDSYYRFRTSRVWRKNHEKLHW